LSALLAATPGEPGGIVLAGAFALTRAMASILFCVSPSDALSLTVTCTLPALVALPPSYIPARQATRLPAAGSTAHVLKPQTAIVGSRGIRRRCPDGDDVAARR
jgi:hypothetical protein